MTDMIYDAIIVGSGITGGWAAKELTEGGMKVLMIERGRPIAHMTDYTTEHKPIYEFPFRMMGDRRTIEKQYDVQRQCPLFDEASSHFFARDDENPYAVDDGSRFAWIRGHQLGGRSLTWGRQSYRMASLNFEENLIDGHGVDWPIRYPDLAPWYAHVEKFIGVAGEPIHNAMSPDGIYQPPFPMNVAEEDLRARFARHWPDRPVTMARTAMLTQAIGDSRQPCHYCGPCERGCSAGAYFSTQSSTLPAAQATGRLTVLTDSIVSRISVDEEKMRATGVTVVDAVTRQESRYSGRCVFLCASALESVRLLLLSATDRQPAGLANSSGMVGKFIMDHHFSDVAMTTVPAQSLGNFTGARSVPLHIPRFQNIGAQRKDYRRGYQLNAGAALTNWTRGMTMKGIGRDFKAELGKTPEWRLILIAQCEGLPSISNRVELDTKLRDKWGIPALRMNVRWTDNDLAMRKDAGDTCVEMMKTAGYSNVTRIPSDPAPGVAIHEMGGAVMGRDPKTSVLDAHNRCHDIPNLFVTDGAAMSSSSSANPSLTYMAMTARAATFAVREWKAGRL
ncbi:Gluconate 2-dehydrogenase (acceptor) [Sphingobium chlorophenolicum L-1]|uniref:Gluconate 2-dehydrogenase (Acceptor) n=1 Tax=Sphingobium chlorophenolicum L-1 TaxID=690566 RepID=F6F3B7_SPHCR|nr:GMC family oxidoreductase [Sphingobium chlorophenolicum]AEG50929.1 Gluconate 2-dehydrogenase (acceptor) [Sphingobium chlorophenolicum L-1]